jgi:hypothetical protein
MTATAPLSQPELHSADHSDRVGSAPYHRQLLRRINELGVPYGREDSFKLTHQQLIASRVLIGIERTNLPTSTMFAIASELGMPVACEAFLAPYLAQANVVLFGIEDRADGSVLKLYLEFWEQVRQEVRRTGARTPQLLHLGVKWDRARPGHHEVARYICHPLLSAVDAMRRMARVYRPDAPQGSGADALAIVRRGIKRNPAVSLLYLEVSESGNPRCSFDINLYKTGLLIADAAPELRQAADRFGIEAGAIEAQLKQLGPCRLGHLSGGTDRHGGEFLSVYGEISAL